MGVSAETVTPWAAIMAAYVAGLNGGPAITSLPPRPIVPSACATSANEKCSGRLTSTVSSGRCPMESACRAPLRSMASRVVTHPLAEPEVPEVSNTTSPGVDRGDRRGLALEPGRLDEAHGRDALGLGERRKAHRGRPRARPSGRRLAEPRRRSARARAARGRRPPRAPRRNGGAAPRPSAAPAAPGRRGGGRAPASGRRARGTGAPPAARSRRRRRGRGTPRPSRSVERADHRPSSQAACGATSSRAGRVGSVGRVGGEPLVAEEHAAGDRGAVAPERGGHHHEVDDAAPEPGFGEQQGHGDAAVRREREHQRGPAEPGGDAPEPRQRSRRWRPGSGSATTTRRATLRTSRPSPRPAPRRWSPPRPRDRAPPATAARAGLHRGRQWR